MPSPLHLLISTLAGISLLSLACGQAKAQTSSADGPVQDAQSASQSGFFAHAGPGALVFDASAKVKAAGAVMPGATVKIDPNETVISEFGYRWKNFGASFTGGLPPVAAIDGAGSLSSLGKLGTVRYGAAVLAAQYHFTQFGRFQPYVGAGPIFLVILRNRDAAVRYLDVRDHVGGAVQLGAEYQMGRRWGLYFDAKKAFLETNATAVLDGTPIKADIQVNPVILSGGLSFHF